MGKDMEENTELENFYIVDYNINVQAPKNWNNSLIKEYSKNLNNSLSPEEKIAYGKKSIPFNEDYTPSVYFTPKDINNVPKLDDAINKRLAFEKYKQEGKDTNWFSTLLRSGWNQSVDITESSYTYLREAPEAIGAGVAWLENQDKLSPESREKWKRDLAKDVIDRMKAREKSASRFKYDINPYESKSAQGMGSLAPTLLATGVFGLASILRGKGLKAALETNAPIASIFGLSSAENMYQNVLENGGSIVDAYIRSNLAGAAETGLEQFGLISLNRFYKRKHFPWLILSSGASEGIQEGSQSIKDIAISGQYDTRTADQKLDDVFDSVWYGSLGGMTFTVGAAKGTNQFLHRRELVYNAAIEAGKSPEMALKLAQGAVPTEGQITEDATEFLNSLVNNVPDVSPEEMQKLAADYEKSIELSRGLDNEDAIAEVSFYDGLLKTLTDAGIQENEAKTQSLYWGRAVKNDYELAKENGVFQGSLSEFQKRWLNLNIANKPNVEAVKVGNQVIEKTVPMTEEEISQIWSKRQAETRQIPDDEIDFFEWRPSRRLFSASAAMYANPRTDIASFYEFVKNNPHHKKSYMIFKSKNGIALDILSDTLKHDNSEHDLSVDEWTDVLENIDNIEDAKFSAKPTSYGNKSFLLKIKTPKRKYGMAIAYVNGHNYVTTLFKTTDKGYEQWVNKTNKKTAVAPAPYPQAGSSSAQNGNVSYGLSVESIVQLLKSNVNKKDIRNNKTLFSKENNQLPPDAYDEKVYGTYDPSEHLIELFKSARPDTLTHELSHHFFQNHFRAAQEFGFSGYDRDVLKWLSRRAKREITNFDDMQNQDWENLTEAFIRYLNTGNSPTIATRGLFEKAKEWILDVFNDNREYANSEVKDFFDSLVSREGEIPNIDNIIKNKADFEEAIQQALRGESATFRGQNRKSIANLRKGLHTRVRRPGMTLDKELKSLGYKVDVLNGRLVDDAGIVEDNRVAEIFMDLGLLDNIDTETYTQTEALSSKIQNILQDAEHIYSRREGEIQRQRDAAIQNQAKIQSFIDDLLKDNKLGLKTIEDLDTLLANVLSKSDDTDIVKVNRNAIKYLQAKLNEMNKEYRNTIKQLYQGEKVRNETRYELQDRLRKFIKNLPISGDRKVSLDGNIQRVKDADSFAKVFNDVRKRARDYIEYEEKQLNRRNIEEIIKSTKPLKFRKQRYTFEDNKFFQEMRDILKLSQGEAAKAFEELSNNIFSDENMAQGVSEYDRVRNMLYNYKINGADTSLALLQDLASSLEQLKNEAVDKRLQEDELKAAVKTENKNELLDAIKTLKKSNWFAVKLAEIGTIRSTMNELFGKKLSDKWNLETAFEKVNIFLRNNSAKVMQQAMNIYGSKSKGDFLQLMQNKSKEEFELRDNDGDYQKMSLLDILDIYIQMKDDNTRANFYAAYETFDDTMPTDRASLRAAIESMSDEQLKEHLLTDNLGKLLSHLSQKDMEFADMLQQEVADMWEIENDIFVKMYGIDLPHNKNYFPRTSKNTLDYDVMENLRVRSQTPSFFKERASTVTPRPKNVWTKYQEYITNVGYVQNVALKYKDLHALMTDKAIRGKIVEKYGDDFYRAFMANLDDLSIKGAVKTYNEVGRLMQTLLNNLVSGTVALNVPMAIKQLPAALNYSVNMPKKEFIKNFMYAATHPAEVKKTMDSYVGDFLKTRFEQGSQSDAIGRAMAEANNLVNSKYSLAGFTHNWRNIATTPIRFADIFAIYWGGYAKLKYNIDKGVSREKIIEDFTDETLSNQAAGNPATRAKYQREQTLRFFTAFRDVPAQYMRLITTTATQWRRGEISDARFYSNIANYVFVQPALYIALGWMIKAFLYGDDDDNWYDGMMTEITLSPIAGLPIIADLARFGVDKIESAVTGKSPEPWDALQVFGVDSLNRLMWKSVKKDKTSWDWAEILGGIVDVGTGAGLGTAVRTVKKIAD